MVIIGKKKYQALLDRMEAEHQKLEDLQAWIDVQIYQRVDNNIKAIKEMISKYREQDEKVVRFFIDIQNDIKKHGETLKKLNSIAGVQQLEESKKEALSIEDEWFNGAPKS